MRMREEEPEEEEEEKEEEEKEKRRTRKKSITFAGREDYSVIASTNGRTERAKYCVRFCLDR